MKNAKISSAVATFNEETNINDCIESLKRFSDEIVVVDGSSKDRTREIAEKLGAKVIKTANKKVFNINKNMAIKNCTGDWIFLIDADERVDKDLAEEIKRVVNANPQENGFWINRKNWFLGGYLKKGGAYPDRVIRLFRKGKGHLPEESVHQQVKIKGKVGHLKKDILHLADPDFNRYLKRANRYTSLTSEEIAKKNPGTGTLTLLQFTFVKPAVTFLSIYIRHRGYVDGFRGFVWALFSAYHHFYAYVKYFSQKTAKKVDSRILN